MQRILVTGGAGFVGSHLAMSLRAWREGLSVVALDNLRRRGSELNLARLRTAGVEFMHGDIRNAEDLDAVGHVDLILECSAEPSVLAGYGGAPGYVVNTNLGGTVNCLELARRHGAGMVFLSTSRVYPMAPLAGLALEEHDTRFEPAPAQTVPGVSPEGVREEFPLDGARSLYGATKLASELLATEYAAMYGLPVVINRCGVLTGPWQMGKVDQGVVVLWAARHFFGGPLKYIGYGGAGKQVRDMLHIDDLARLVWYQLTHLDTVRGQVFNVGGGRGISVSLCELTALCEEITGKHIEITAEPTTRPADIPWYVTDNTKVTGATGWQPQWGAHGIVEDVCRWIADHRTELAAVLG